MYRLYNVLWLDQSMRYGTASLPVGLPHPQRVADAAWRGDRWPEGFEPGLDESCYVDPSQATTPSQRVDYAFRRTLAREPSPQEADSMLQHYEEWAEHYRRSEDRAAATVAAALHDAPPETNPIELAPWIVVANVMLNLDETMTRE